MLRSLLVLSSLALLAACSPQNQHHVNSDHSEGIVSPLVAAPTFSVVNKKGAPISGAQILIGTKQGDPFAGNFLATDESGRLALPNSWADVLPVTIQAPGYIRVTFFDGRHQDRTFVLQEADMASYYELNGRTSGYGSLPRDGQVDFGLVISAMDKQGLFRFDLEKVISAEVDKISIIGNEIEIPSNIALPKQKESYILPITLEKEPYRIYFREQGLQNVFVAHGQFPLKDVADELKGGTPFYALVNYFKFTHGAIKQVNITDKKNTVNLEVNQMSFSRRLQVQSPKFPGDHVILAVALSERDGAMYPSDVKRLSSGQLQRMNLPESGNPMITSILAPKAEMENRGPLASASVHMATFTEKFEPNHLGIPAKPEVFSRNELRLAPPATVAGVVPTGTFALLSRVESRVEAGSSVQKTRLWQAYGLGWSTNMQLPEWPDETLPVRGLRWEVTFIGSASEVSSPSGPELLEQASHVAYSVKDF